MPSTLENLASELAAALVLARSGLASQRNTADLLDVLGWEPPPGGIPHFPDLHLEDLLAKLAAAQAAATDVELHTGDGGLKISLNARYAELAAAVAQTLTDLRGLAGGFAGWPANYLALTNIQNDFTTRLLNYLIFQSLMDRHPTLFGWLDLFGLVEAAHFDADHSKFQTEHLRYALRFDRLGALLSTPPALFAARFGWGTASFDFEGFLASLGLICQSLGGRPEWGGLSVQNEAVLLGRAVPEAATDPLPKLTVTLVRGPGDAALSLILAPLRPSAPGGADGGIALGPCVSGTADTAFTLLGPFRLEISSKLDLSAGALLTQRPNQPPAILTNLAVDNPGRGQAGELQLGLRYPQPDGRPISVLELPGGLRLEVGQFGINFGGRQSGGAAELYIEVELNKAAFVLNAGAISDLLAAILPVGDGQADLDLAIGWAGGRGAYLLGSTQLQATFPVDRSIGPVDLQSVTVDVAPDAGKLPIEVSATLGTTLGPLTLLIERAGLSAAFEFPGGAGGNLGPLNIGLGFKVPTGIGLALDAGPVRGGGYLSLDLAGQRYGGVLQLNMPFAHVVAFGILERVQGRASFIAVLGIRFNPGVQIGFGFALTGVGGLVGLNHRANVDLLRERVASGAAGNVLFCQDPVKNAPTILGDLNAFFPPAPGGYLVGPTAQISWLAPIVRIDLGILIELPGPTKIVILGSLRAIIGLSETSELLYLRMDVLGIVDFEKHLISIDASLVASHALGVFRLTGGMAFRLGYGSNPYVLLSVGGFHPRFDPGPLNIPHLARVGAALDLSVVVSIYVRLELYVAFTSNTLQAGAKVEAGLDIGPLSVHGYFQFDALVQFRPFYFQLDFSAGFAVEVFGYSFASVDIDGQISGPGPVVIHAHGSVRRLFLKVSGRATFELGRHDGDQPASIEHPVLELAPELKQVTNLRAAGDDPTVVLRPGRAAVNGVLVSPRGSLIWEQKRAPLNTLIDRLGGVPLDHQHQLLLDPPGGWFTSEERDWFNPGSFTNLDLKASQTLNNATFQELPAGIHVGNKADSNAPGVVDYQAEILLIKRPDRSRFHLLVGTYMNSSLHSAMRDRTMTPAVDPGPPKVAVTAETASVHGSDGKLLYESQSPFQAFQVARQETGRFATPTADVVVKL
jgi:hypothetical protein